MLVLAGCIDTVTGIISLATLMTWWDFHFLYIIKGERKGGQLVSIQFNSIQFNSIQSSDKHMRIYKTSDSVALDKRTYLFCDT
jgi:hypothetical protein